MIAHCLFEQSGTFKNEFRKLGYDAYDYDILDNYGETDFNVDLFDEIDQCTCGKPSIFDKMTPEDLVLAFFPCTRFEDQIMLAFRGEAPQQKNWSDSQKLIYSMQLHSELHRNYFMISRLVLIAPDRGLRLVIENPYSQQHYLKKYWPIKPAVIDKDRTLRGDHFKKPTQYFFINMEPKNNIIFEPLVMNEVYKIDYAHKIKNGKSLAENRSMISSDYANRFIREWLID